TRMDADDGKIGGEHGNKVRGDAVGNIRGLAPLRSRNGDWGERAVREGISAHTDEAVQQHIVDLEADDLDGLLKAIDGRKVSLDQGEATLATANAPGVYNRSEERRVGEGGGRRMSMTA